MDLKALSKKIKAELEQNLSEHRYLHTISVADTALEISKALQSKFKELNEQNFLDKLYIAGLLHDFCKEYSNKDLLTLAEYYKIKIYPEDKLSPNLLHARVGAAFAEEHFEILDPVILSAIKEHTLGGLDMELSSKIIYLADMIEPRRDAKDKAKDPNKVTYLDEVRTVIYNEQELDKALLLAFDKKLKHTIKKSKAIHPLSIESRNDLLKSSKSLLQD